MATFSLGGYVKQPDGSQQACVWRSNGQSGFDLTLLPWSPGANSVAYDVEPSSLEIPNLKFAVGSAQDQAGVWKPVLWREVLQGVFVPVVLPTLGGASGSAYKESINIYNNLGVVHHIVGTTQMASGALRATVWRDTPQGWQASDLGTLGGGESEALAIVCPRRDPQPAFCLVAGRAQTPSGNWHSALWRTTDGGENWTVQDLNPPGAVSSQFKTLSGMDSETEVVEFIAGGDATFPDGRTVGLMVTGTYDNNDLIIVSSAHHRNGSVEGVLATRYGARLVGSAWNAEGSLAGVIWNSLPGSDGTHTYLADAWDFTNDPARLARNLQYHDIGEGAIACSATGLIQPRTLTLGPATFITDGTQLPDIVEVHVGTTPPNVNETTLWHDDGKSLTVLGDVSKGGFAQFVTKTYVSDSAPLDWGAVIEFSRAQTVGSPDGSAELVIQFHNFVTGQWDPGASTAIDTGARSGASSPLGGAHIHPFTGEVRARFTLVPISGLVAGYRIDEAVLTPIPPP